MTVGELIALLQKEDPSLRVVKEKDWGDGLYEDVYHAFGSERIALWAGPENGYKEKVVVIS